jgi:ADP-ribose pyrophosphatase
LTCEKLDTVPQLTEYRKVYSGELSVSINKFRVNGKSISKELVEYSDSVGIIPVDKYQNLVLIQQYRFAAKKSLIEIPAGKVESGETPEKAALRELNEETGYSGKLKPLIKWYLAPGYSTEKMHIFVATDLKRSKKRLGMDIDEHIITRKMSLDTALKKCLRGNIEDCKTISAIMLYSRLNPS